MPSTSAALRLADLSRMPAKVALYDREVHFREGRCAASEVLGHSALEVVSKSALVMLKPDAIAFGHASATVAFLRANEFKLTWASWVDITRLHSRELWRYQQSAATVDRLAVTDLVVCGRALILVVVQGERSSLPASVRLSQLKGSAVVADQSPGCLRRQLGQVNRLLSFVHVANEPADVLRETAILFTRSRLESLWIASRDEVMPADASEVVKAVESEAFRGKLDGDFDAALKRLETAVADAGGEGDRASRILLSEALHDMHEGRLVDWRRFMLALARCNVAADRWDLALVGSRRIAYDDPGAEKVLDSVEPQRWDVPAKTPSDGR